MPLIPKHDVNQIFASQAPTQDTPPEFKSYTGGWGVESRPNNGKPTIKGFNKLQQVTDEKLLWIHQNGAALPFDENMEYAENAPVIKDGVLVQKKGSEWKPVSANKASDILDESGLTQQQINSSGKVVALVSDLKKIGAKNGDVVTTNGHTVVGLGGGTFVFEALSSKNDNGGTWIGSTTSSGVWVLISKNYIEQFGVLPNNEDQSLLIQNAIDFYLNNNVRSFGFEKSNRYCIASPIRFKQVKVSESESYADPKLSIKFDMNGAYFDALSANQIAVVVSRDNVQIDNLIVTSKQSGVIGLYNGLDIENDDLTLRRSSMRMILNNPKFEGLDVGIKFEPASEKDGVHWGSFYHCVYNAYAIKTNIMYEFRQSIGSGVSSNTRNTFIGSKHVGGSCTVYGEALESSVFLGTQCEFITKADSRLPNGEAVCIYLPYGTPSDHQSSRANTFRNFNVEVCTNYINIDAPDTEVNGYFQGATNPRLKSWIYNNTYGNVAQIEGGLRINAYNKTPRFGLTQFNDDKTTNNLYVEVDTSSNNYQILCDNRVELGEMTFGKSAKVKTPRLNFYRNDDKYSFYVDYSSVWFPTLGSTAGELGLGCSLIPTSDNLFTLGSQGNRYGKVFSGNINLSSLNTFADNNAAKGSGLIVGDIYKTATGQLMVVY